MGGQGDRDRADHAHPGARSCHRPVAAAAGYRLAELAAGGDLEQAMASEAISSQLKRLTQNWTICVQAREPPTRKSAARITRYVCYLSSVLLPEQSLFATSGEARQVGDLLPDRIRLEAD